MDQINSKTGKLTQSRREFVERAGITAVMSTFGLAFFTACSESEDTAPGTTTTPPPASAPTGTNGVSVSGNIIRIDLAAQARLATAGGWLLIINAQTLVV
ncbi:MAG: Rieske (2Fe-2S) protein, partial [Algoriphagus sp.]